MKIYNYVMFLLPIPALLSLIGLILKAFSSYEVLANVFFYTGLAILALIFITCYIILVRLLWKS